MLKYKVEYDAISVEEYEKKYQKQQLKYLKKKAAKLGYQLVPIPTSARRLPARNAKGVLAGRRLLCF